MRTVNKSCLQKPREQTRCTVKTRPNPHLGCPERVQEWLAREEQAIDKRYTERMVDFDEPLPEEDQAHLDSIREARDG